MTQTCPICGKEMTVEPCLACQKTIHKRMNINCIIECGPNGLSRQDGAFLIDQFTKLFLSRGIAPIDIDFLEPYVWMDVDVSKDDIKKLQEKGILQQ